MHPLRIAFDGRAFTFPAGGVRRYATELSSAILRVAPDVTLAALGAATESDLPEGVISIPPAWSLPSNLGWALSGLPLAARRWKYDVFHAPAYTAPLWGVSPVVLTLHDVSYARHPEWYPHARDPIRRAFYRASTRVAARVITDSAFSRGEIMLAYGVRADCIDVIPLAPGSRFVPPAHPARKLFVLHVGELHLRRNLEMLLDVVIDLRRSDRRWATLKLVLAGADRGALERLQQRAGQAGSAEALDYVGRPSDARLLDLYQRAAVFAYPSRYEGFGLPVVEAMACGCPVVASSAGAVPEVVGQAAIVVDPDDAHGWHGAVRVVLDDAGRAAAMSEASLARAAQFSWDRTARATLETYDRALGVVAHT